MQGLQIKVEFAGSRTGNSRNAQPFYRIKVAFCLFFVQVMGYSIMYRSQWHLHVFLHAKYLNITK